MGDHTDPLINTGDIRRDALNALRELIEHSDHEQGCPEAGEKSTEGECPCGYKLARRRAEHVKRNIEEVFEYLAGGPM